MAESYLELDGGWLQSLHALEREFFTERLGPDILTDAQTGCPVDTARLVDSLAMQVIDDEGDGKPTLEVGSYPDEDGEVEYAAAVEYGFNGPEIVRAHERMGIPVAEFERHGYSPEQSFLRPAAYRERY